MRHRGTRRASAVRPMRAVVTGLMSVVGAGLVVTVMVVLGMAGCEDSRRMPAGGAGVGDGAATGVAGSGTSPGAPVRWGSSAPSGSASSSTASAQPTTYRFPVSGVVSYERVHHDYPASDIMAACGAAVSSVTSGVVLEVNRVDRYEPQVDDGATRGGVFVSVLGDDGVRYYGSHLASVAAGLAPGVRVRAGQRLGVVGRTGLAGACHLHFGISPPCQRVGDWWLRRGVVWPWSYLDAWRQGRSASPVSAVTAWQRMHGCPASAPAT